MSDREDLIKSYETGNFLETVDAISLNDRTERSVLAMELATLHNDGLIDVVEAFEPLGNSSSNGTDFFLKLHVFEEVLPNLNASVPTVMQCVLQLYYNAGQDMASGMILESFIDFCTKELTRPHEALTEIEADPDKFANLLTAVLIAGSRIDNPSYLTKAIQLCEDKNIELRRHAVFALGKLNCLEGEIGSLAALERSVTVETDDQILANIVRSAFAFLQQDKNQLPLIHILISNALSKGNECTHHAASELFGFHTDKLSDQLLDVLLVHLTSVKPINKATLDNIDYGISHLLKKGDLEKTIKFLEGLLIEHPKDLTMKVFDSASRDILCNKSLLQKILTRWFMRGDRVLCDGVDTIISMYHGDNLLLEIDPTELAQTDVTHILFVAKKAIGYFLLTQSTCAANILISLMQHSTDEEALEELGQLLFDPLLLNFTGKAREHVEQQSKLASGKVKETIDKALKSIDDYLDDLQSVGTLTALHPNQAQREAYRRYFSDLMSDSYKVAESQSFLLNLFPKTILLYGQKSINYVYNSDGQSQRMEIPLQSHGTSWEVPRMENIDPFGLDYMLRIFRNERIKA
jgi:hypothetical protein